jgi:hypothetical protein
VGVTKTDRLRFVGIGYRGWGGRAAGAGGGRTHQQTPSGEGEP